MRTLKLLFHFTVHIATGTAMFRLLASVAFGLFEFTRLLEAHGLSKELGAALHGVADLSFAVDMLLYVLFLAIETFKLAAEMWAETKVPNGR